MANMNATPQQIQAAATAGVELLADKEVRVPLGISIGGRLSMLHSILSAVASGELILTNPPTPEQQATAAKEDGDQKPNLEAIAGGKKGEDPPK